MYIVVTNSVQHNPSGESDTFLAGQEILYILWNLKIITVFTKAYS